MKKLLGYFLVSLPFVALIIFMLIDLGVLVTLNILVTVGLITSSIWVGLDLIHSKR